MTIAQLEDTFIEDLNCLDDWFLQYEYLLQISADMPPVAEPDRTTENRVPDCLAGVWLILRLDRGRVRVLADSEALIIRGILSIYVQLLDNRLPEEIAAFQPRFIEVTSMKKQLSRNRSRNLQAIFERIRSFAASCIAAEAE